MIFDYQEYPDSLTAKPITKASGNGRKTAAP